MSPESRMKWMVEIRGNILDFIDGRMITEFIHPIF